MLAICHEVGNHLAATRLSAHWAAQRESRAQIEEANQSIQTLAAEAAALLGHVRPLLVADPGETARVSPREAVAAVVDEVEGLPGRLRVVVRQPARTAFVEVDPNLLHATLLSLVLSAGTRARPRKPVGLALSERGRRVCFTVEEPARKQGSSDARKGSSPPRGLDLLVAVADRALRSAKGRAVLRRDGASPRVEILLPARAAPRARSRRRARAPSRSRS